jgi:phosphoglycolate phosphatase-like HAD superfamily hydrolase
MANLILFDLDGTLLESVGFDAESYVAAVKTVLLIDNVDEDWDHYVFATDAGILEELYQKHFQQAIPKEVEQRVRDKFADIMLERFQKDHVRLRPLPGAEQAVHLLLSGGQWEVGIATGSWRESAELKLMNAMLELDRVPIFSASDAVSRTAIMGLAVKTMQAKAGVKEFEKIVYLGDAPWDVRASRELGLAFVGVGARALELSRLGASHTIKDYTDQELFLKSIVMCEVPKAV